MRRDTCTQHQNKGQKSSESLPKLMILKLTNLHIKQDESQLNLNNKTIDQNQYTHKTRL
jgi:hypothetical protein